MVRCKEKSKITQKATLLRWLFVCSVMKLVFLFMLRLGREFFLLGGLLVVLVILCFLYLFGLLLMSRGLGGGLLVRLGLLVFGVLALEVLHLLDLDGFIFLLGLLILLLAYLGGGLLCFGQFFMGGFCCVGGGCCYAEGEGACHSECGEFFKVEHRTPPFVSCAKLALITTVAGVFFPDDDFIIGVAS